MNIEELEVCPGTLAEGFATYSPLCSRKMFDGKKVNHVLDYNSVQRSEETVEQFIENRKRISISGVQEKLSFRLKKKKLVLTEEGEQGTFILKPIPRDLKKVDQAPANEHLTMQIAKQVYNLRVAENALVFFKDGQAAYLTKRFDVKKDGTKWGVEDFASLSGKTVDSDEPNFKYNYNYEKAAELIRNHVSAWRIEIERYFLQVLFNYLFSNGDAHLKNFSLLETNSGDYLISPAYDLINTRIHGNDTSFALDKGLFDDDFRSRSFKKNGEPCKTDFIEFARRIGVTESRISKLIAPFLEHQQLLEKLVSNSFLSKSCKKGYLIHYNTRRKNLNRE